MQITRIHFDKIPQFSARDKAYTTQQETLRPFYTHAPKIEAFQQAINARKNFNHRQALVQILQDQYKNTPTTAAVQHNITALQADNTFTVITGHQPSLATGPLYFIYKIISTINLAEQLREAYPSHNFVPIYWMGSEDHDFQEINHFHLFGKKITWENDEKGAVGKMSTQHIQPILAELKTILGDSPNAQKIYQILHEAYAQNNTLDEATFYLVNQLFQQYGLVVFVTSSHATKVLFKKYIHQEIFNEVSYPIVNQTISQLEKIGFKGQAKPREINFFYMREGLRERIIREGDTFKVLNTDYVFSPSEMENEIETFPERFSPNVIMRPLFQEVVFPNIAYIGGGGEIAYWLERKAQFGHFGVPFPVLVRRASVMWISKNNKNKLSQIGLQIEDIFRDEASLITEYVQDNSKQELTLNEARTALENTFDKILTRTQQIDKSLEKNVFAEKTKALKSIDALEQKLLRAEKRKYETSTNRIKSIKGKLFPSGGLQERKDNFIAFYLEYGDEFIELLKKEIRVMDEEMLVITES